MSLADRLRYLRAMKGGVDTETIAQEIGLDSPAPINQAEVRYRPVYDTDLIDKLADYYGRPHQEFHWHNARPRKFLTFTIAQAMRSKESVTLTLRSGQTLTGTATWWDLSSIGLLTEEGHLLVVQRHAVVDWPGATEWEDV
jgi:sRNA-binding regulator protein Hfq